MKTKITSSLLAIASLIVSGLTPLAIMVPRAVAAADTCVWTGGGTPAVDSTADTITFDVSDAANWSGCDNGTVPEAGDILEFPANEADVDPTDAHTDDSSWRYVVNNDLTAGTSFEAIDFTGDRGTDCYEAVNDRYIITGNSMSLVAGVTDNTTNCPFQTSVLDLSLTLTADASLTVEIGDYVSPNGTNTVTFGANSISVCDIADTERDSRYINLNAKLVGTGDVSFACSSSNVTLSEDSTFGDVVVESNSSIYGDSSSLGISATRTFTFKDKATFGFSEYTTDGDVEFKSNLVFEGDGSTVTYCVKTECIGDGSKTVEGWRGYAANSKYDYESKKTSYYKTTFSGDVTLSHNTAISADTDVAFTGALSGDYTLGTVPGYRGMIFIDSSDNQSATPNGKIESQTYTKLLTDAAYEQYIQYGQLGVLQEGEEIDDKITVGDGGVLKGVGAVAGIDIQSGGTLAPGNSPGCITSNGDLTITGNYDVELEGTTECSGYDQTVVTGEVDLSNGTLNTSLLNGYDPALDNTYTIIKNDDSDAVTGEFASLPEGSRFDVDGVTFEISYKGGDGNDATLKVVGVPASSAAAGTPDTGVGSLLGSPIAAIASLVLVAGTALAYRRFETAKSNK